MCLHPWLGSILHQGMARVHENLLVREELSMVCADLTRVRDGEVAQSCRDVVAALLAVPICNDGVKVV